ncbi:MAG: phosphatase PAP2 family protein [Candidatus Moranbacteria bacterium]|nr:phosphatase PAP2 family protein [Candidatus Moranbacteria bacterium]
MDFLISLLPAVSRLGILGYIVAAGISLAESLPFVGLLLPGTVFILFFGFFSSQGYLDFGTLFWSVMLGAMIGDSLGFWLGTKGVHLFRAENRILRLSHLEKGQKFFSVHGNKSVLLGRFVGPLRPIVPFVAGLTGMPWWRFLLWDLIASVLWAWSHLTLGYFFGGAAAVIETWFTRASAFLLLLSILTFLLWYVAKRSRPFFRLARSIIRSAFAGVMDNPDIRRFAGRYPGVASFLRGRFDTGRFSGLPTTLFSLAFLYLVFLLTGTVDGVVTAEPILLVDDRVANLMFAFRDAGFVRAFLWVTLLGRRDVVIVVMLATVSLAVLWKRRMFILPLLVSVGGAQLFVSLGKRLVHRPRPDIAYYAEPSFSFPSGHATLSVALYGFIAYLLLRTAAKRWRYRTVTLFAALLVIVLVGLSRLYLGVHYLSDVWSGYLLGALSLIIGISISETRIGKRPPHAHLSGGGRRHRRLRIVSGSILAVIFSWYVYQGAAYVPVRSVVDLSESETVSDDVAGAFATLGLPRYSETFSGTHQEPMSFIVIVRDERTFVDVMERAGWLLSDPVTVSNMTHLAEASLLRTGYPRAPMTPSFWNTRVHDPGFQKQTSEGTVHARHHARFWKAPIRTRDGDSVFVGTASLDIGIKWLVTHRIAPDIDTEREVLFGDLRSTGMVADVEKVRFVDPVLGKNFSGDPFFTDGETYVLRLR